MELLEGLLVVIATCAALGVGLGLAAKIAIYVVEFKWGNDE